MLFDTALCQEKVGCGLFNKFLQLNLPELHYPGYRFLGPFTKTEARIARGESGTNSLDEAAREHDLYYMRHKDTKSRHTADKILQDIAWKRIAAKDSSVGERVAGLLTSGAMLVKRKAGMGLKRKKSKEKSRAKRKKNPGRVLKFHEIVKKAKTAVLKKGKKKDLKKLISLALEAVGSRKGALKSVLKSPRIIPIPKSGGFLPLIPILTGISKIGAIAGGATSIFNAIKDIINMRREMKNGKGMSSKQVGSGLFLRPYKRGLGLFLNPPKNSRNL